MYEHWYPNVTFAPKYSTYMYIRTSRMYEKEKKKKRKPCCDPPVRDRLAE